VNTSEADVTLPEAEDGPPLWNPDVAGVWSLFLTPVFGSVILMLNYRSMGDEAGYVVAQRWLAVSLVMLLAMTPVRGGAWLSLAYLLVWYFGVQRAQTRLVARRWGKRYPKKGWGRPLAIGVGAGVVWWLAWNIAAWGLTRVLA
jgi:hypothetical protein